MKTFGRKLLRWACDQGMPGRYVIVENLVKWLTPIYPVVGRAGWNIRISCDLTDQIQRQIYFGLYDPRETILFQQLLKPGDVVFDVGANVGYYSLLAAEICGTTGQVHAFEPIRENSLRLEENAMRNGFANIQVNQVAVTDGAANQITIFQRQSGGNSGWASIVPSPTRGNTEIQVPAISLDAYVTANNVGRVSVVKLDCEGAETLVLGGAQVLLSQTDAPDLLCELNPFHLTRIGSSGAGLKTLIAGYGYELHEITEHGLKRLEPTKDEFKQINFLASKRGTAMKANEGEPTFKLDAGNRHYRDDRVLIPS